MDAGAVENPLPAPLNDEEGEVPDPVAACDSLAGLTNLRDLSFSAAANLLPGDALALTALTGLTRLVLAHLEHGVGDLAACALACSLKQLRHLDLQECDLGDMVCLAAIAHLTQLTELRLGCTSGFTRQRLMLLTGLTDLQRLGFCSDEEIRVEVMDSFWAVLQQQQQQQQQ
ncbi:hypothetical protein COO60DRAFT_1648566 [Scenedesmus sp. NREL 46B-D3]|nr:hypothetical protein COO60DRAFT_1648566 [Scenedesmus sp. NREL 46B-D3]